MASAPQNYPPMPPTPPIRRSLFGPVVILSLGVIFLLVTTGRVPGRAVFPMFAKYWPVLLILWGVAKLFDHWRATRDGYRATGIGAGGVFVLIVLTVCGLAATGAYRASAHMDWDEFRDEFQINDEDGFSMVFGKKFEFDETFAQALPANGTVKVVTERGSIKVVPSTDQQVHVIAHKTIYADDQAQAEKFKESVTPRITTDGSLVNIDFSRHGDWRGGRVDLEVSVPKGAFVEATTLRGDLNIRGRAAGIKANASRGSVTLENIAGSAEVHLRRNGDFIAKNIAGDVSVEGRVDNVQIADVGGLASLDGEYYGDIQLSKVAKGVRFKSSRTDVELVRLDGDFDMGGGDLRVRNFTGPFRISTRSKDISLEDYTGDVRIVNRNAEIDLRPKQIGNIDVQNRSGRIRLLVPGTANFEVNARADRGEVTTDFNLNKNEDGRTQLLAGVVNKGGPKVLLNTEHGTIAVFKSEGTRAREEAPSIRKSDDIEARIEEKLREKERQLEERMKQAEKKLDNAEKKIKDY